MDRNRIAFFIGLAASLTFVHLAAAQDATSNPTNTRYGLLNLLDSRSVYGTGVFPEPFLVDDSDGEVNEARLDWFHSETPDQQSDVITAEVEKGFGPLTLEVEVPFERDRAFDPDAGAFSTVQGFDNIDLGARCPFYQYVSQDGFFDNTVGAAIEVGVPTNSIVSKNTEVVPKLFYDLAIGKHFTFQTIEGYSQLFGSGDDGNLETFEYGFDFGWTIHHDELPLPGIYELIPVFELSGGTQLNKDQPGRDDLLGNIAMRFNLANIGPVQPKLGIGYVFPIDKGARDDFHWGIYTSLVFEY